jgi:hypothetical protein
MPTQRRSLQKSVAVFCELSLDSSDPLNRNRIEMPFLCTKLVSISDLKVHICKRSCTYYVTMKLLPPHMYRHYKSLRIYNKSFANHFFSHFAFTRRRNCFSKKCRCRLYASLHRKLFLMWRCHSCYFNILLFRNRSVVPLPTFISVPEIIFVLWASLQFARELCAASSALALIKERYRPSATCYISMFSC